MGLVMMTSTILKPTQFNNDCETFHISELRLRFFC